MITQGKDFLSGGTDVSGCSNEMRKGLFSQRRVILKPFIFESLQFFRMGDVAGYNEPLHPCMIWPIQPAFLETRPFELYKKEAESL